MLRKAAERTIQQNHDMRKKTQILNAHSELVGRNIYDQSQSRVRAEFVNYMSFLEAPGKRKRDSSNFDIENRKRMRSQEKVDAITRRENAEKYLAKEEEIRNRTAPVGSRRKLLPNDRLYLQKLIKKEVFGDIVQDFPQGIRHYIFV